MLSNHDPANDHVVALCSKFREFITIEEERRQYTSLQERLEDDEWVGVYLDLAKQQYWLDPVEGVRSLLPFMLAAAIYRRDINEDAVAVGQFFSSHSILFLRKWK